MKEFGILYASQAEEKNVKKFKMYLDTSIINFVFADDAPQEKEITLKLFNELDQHEVYVSTVVIDEINRSSESKRAQLFDVLGKYNIVELQFSEEARILADKYVAEKIIPEKYRDDAYHIAIATVNNIDVIVSWNFKHMVKLKTKKEVVGINLFLGYNAIEIYSPWEVVDNV